MGIRDLDTIDKIGTDKETGHVVLTMVDKHDWTDEMQHLYELQEKINVYLSYIESGEIYSDYPEFKGREIDILLCSQYEIPLKGIGFLHKAAEVVRNAGYHLKCIEWNPEGEENWKVIF